MKSYTFWSDRHAQTRQNFRVSQLLKQNSIKVPSPAKLSERTHATRKINTTIAFLAFDIKVSLKEPHRSLHKKHWKWKRSIRHFVFIPQMLRHAGKTSSVHADEADFQASDWLKANGRRNFKLFNIHDQVYGARWFEHFLKILSFLAIWYRTTEICCWMMSSRERKFILFCFQPLPIHQIEYRSVLISQIIFNKRKICLAWR